MLVAQSPPLSEVPFGFRPFAGCLALSLCTRPILVLVSSPPVGRRATALAWLRLEAQRRAQAQRSVFRQLVAHIGSSPRSWRAEVAGPSDNWIGRPHEPPAGPCDVIDGMQRLKVIDGMQRLKDLARRLRPWPLSGGDAKPPIADLPVRPAQVGGWVSVVTVLVATVLKTRIVAAWRSAALGLLLATSSRTQTTSALLACSSQRAHIFVVLPQTSPSLTQSGPIIEAAELSQLGTPAALPQQLRIMRRLFRWLTYRGIADAERRCRIRNAGPTWSSLRQRQHRRCATAQGALAGREPPACNPSRSAHTRGLLPAPTA